ncbi:MAG: FkbM family methyltransferase [Notoacmeibacter sp.]|nr:FkbM family methyltransferase [Notoacmeibacter sp.]
MKSAFSFRNKNFSFSLNSAEDAVQRPLSNGRFYEHIQLEKHINLIPARATVLDVGANIGNHTVFYGAFSKAEKIFPFEPNPSTNLLLKQNVINNDLSNVDLSFSHLGCGAEKKEMKISLPVPDRPGRARLVDTNEQHSDVLVVESLDNVFPDRDIHFVKIDVESMELDVLSGAKNLIDRCRPAIAIEVDLSNMNYFRIWREKNNYSIIECYRPHKANWNFLLVPA